MATKIHIPTKKSLPAAALVGVEAKRKMLIDTAKKVVPGYLKEHRARVRERATEHYQNAIEQIRQVLSSNLAPNVASAPGKYEDRPAKEYTLHIAGIGRRHRVVTPPWVALNAAYAASKPKNVTFWYKHGNLYRAFKSLGKPKAKVRPVKVVHGKGPAGTAPAGVSKAGHEVYHVRAVEALDFHRMPYPFGKVITDSFKTGTPLKEVAIPTGDLPKNSIERGYFPERQRPFIALTAATLGRAMYDKLRKLK